MRKKLLALVATLATCMSINAFTNMIVKQKDGSSVKINTKKIRSVVIEKSKPEDLLVPDTSELPLKFRILPNYTAVEVVNTSSCNELESIEIPEKVRIDGRVLPVTAIAKDAFNSFKMKSITIPASIREIGARAFRYCSNLTSITLPEELTLIDDNAFENCKGLTSITLPEGITVIHTESFINCTGLTSIELPKNLIQIDYSAFKGCSQLSDIDIPSSVTKIAGDAFSGCNFTPGLLTYDNGTKLYGWVGNKALCVDVVIPDGVTTIGVRAFYECKNLANVTIHKNVTFIDYYAFAYCTSLTTVEIPEALTSISSSTFFSCSALTDIKLSSNITSIDDNAFNKCENLDLVIDNSEDKVQLGFLALSKVKSVTWLKESTSEGTGSEGTGSKDTGTKDTGSKK